MDARPDFYTEAQEMILVTVTVKAWSSTRRKWLPRFLRPKVHATAVFRGVEVPAWEPTEVPLHVFRALDAYLEGHVGLDNSEIVIHDVGIKGDLPELPVGA